MKWTSIELHFIHKNDSSLVSLSLSLGLPLPHVHLLCVRHTYFHNLWHNFLGFSCRLCEFFNGKSNNFMTTQCYAEFSLSVERIWCENCYRIECGKWLNGYWKATGVSFRFLSKQTGANCCKIWDRQGSRLKSHMNSSHNYQFTWDIHIKANEKAYSNKGIKKS